jgi:hypothetical protein
MHNFPFVYILLYREKVGGEGDRRIGAPEPDVPG